MNDMKIARKIKALFRAQYRLTALYAGDTKPRNIYGINGKLLRRMAKRLGADYWTLYKRGPFFLPERWVDKGYKEGGGE